MRTNFRRPLVDLMRQIKLLFPAAQILFQSVLPIKLTEPYTCKSVHDFNELLIELCIHFGYIFLDCLSEFVDNFGFDYNSHLYRDRWHLNSQGLRTLCKIYKFSIYNNVFNPCMRISNSHYFYNQYKQF